VLYGEQASQAQLLQATEKLQSALLNSISHDLRTPLVSITGALSSLREDSDALPLEIRQELIETAYDDAGRLNRLVANLLNMTRIEAGALHIDWEPCDVQDLIGSALQQLGGRLGDHAVQVQIPEDLPLVQMDFVLMVQVLVNLLDNAAKYSPPGAAVEVHVQFEQDWIALQVLDCGPGIPDEDLPYVFDKFYRVKRPNNVSGTGLGLAICKGIVDAHGGRIQAENRLGSGSVFTVWLPADGEGQNG
jgi:two-component system sensor histidine kinase KdpD